MSRRPTRLLVATVALALAVTGTTGCSDPDDGRAAAPDDTIEGLLGLVPDTEAYRSFVLVSRYRDAAAGAGLDEQGPDDEGELARLAGLQEATGLAPGGLLGDEQFDDRIGALDYVPSEVTAEVTVGTGAERLDLGLVDADESEVLDAAAAVDDAERTEVDGVDVVRWYDDASRRDTDTPLGEIPGQSGRVAWPAEGVLAHTVADDPLAAAIGTIDGDDASLADDEGLAAVAEALDDADAFGAVLTATPLEVTQPRGSSGREAPVGGLDAYRALGVGSAWTDDGLQLIIAIAHDTDDEARANADRLADGVADGQRARTAEPWSDLLTDVDITTEGSLVVGRFSVEQPGLWLKVFVDAEPLLAVG